MKKRLDIFFDGRKLFLSNLAYIISRIMKISPLFFILSLCMALFAGLQPVMQSYFISRIIDSIGIQNNFKAVIFYGSGIVFWLLVTRIINRITFALNKAIYILDEPSAALDAKAENEVFKIINGLKGKATVLFITHRMTSIMDTDTGLFLEPGGKICQADHNTLMQNKPEYNELYRAQANRFVI